MRIITMALLSLTLLLAACSSYRKNTDYMDTADYQQKAVLKKSILEGDILDEKEVQKILTSRVQFPKKMRIAVMRLKSQVSNLTHFHQGFEESLKQNMLNDNFINGFYKKLASNGNIESVIPVPTGLIPATPNLTQLRQIALRMQAHLALIVDANSDLNTDFNFFEASTYAKSYTASEYYLIDTATGIILTSGTLTDIAELKKEGKDYDVREAMKRAKLESEKKIFARIGTDVSEFLTKAK